MYHVVIKQEMRTDPDRQAISINTGVGQLHTLGASFDPANPNLVYVAEWDEVNSSLVVLLGAGMILNMRFAGWPE